MNNPQYGLGDYSVSPSVGSDESVRLGDITGFLKENAVLILATAFIGLFVALLYVLGTDKSYTARSQILIEPKIPQLQQRPSDVNLSLDTSQLESQMAVLQSEKIASMVVEELKLLDRPAFQQMPASPAERIVRGGGKFASSAVYALSMSKPDPVEQSSSVDNSGYEQLSDYEKYRLAIAVFQSNLRVTRLGVSYAIEIAFTAPDAQLAADIANATASAYVREQVESKARAAREGSEWLEQRLEDLRTQMNQATQAAQRFRARHDYAIGSAADEPAPGADGALGDRMKGPTLEELEVNADTYRKMYESVLEAYMNSVSQQSYPTADARVITLASSPLGSSQPRTKLLLFFGVLCGLSIGVALAFGRLVLDNRIRSPRQLWQELGVECLGVLPSPPGRWISGTAFRAITQFPRSAYTAGMAKIRLAINVSDTATSSHRIGVTSVSSHENSSIFATNLAAIYAQKGASTLLIDLSGGKSSLAENLAVSSVSAKLSEEAGDLESRRVIGQRFDLISGNATLARRLASNRSKDLADLNRKYEVILINLPPLLAGLEDIPVEDLVGGTVIVSRWAQTPIGSALDLVNTLKAMKISIVGAVLTGVPGSSAHNNRHSATAALRTV